MTDADTSKDSATDLGAASGRPAFPSWGGGVLAAVLLAVLAFVAVRGLLASGVGAQAPAGLSGQSGASPTATAGSAEATRGMALTFDAGPRKAAGETSPTVKAGPVPGEPSPAEVRRDQAAIRRVVTTYVEANARMDRDTMDRCLTDSASKTFKGGDAKLIMRAYRIESISKPAPSGRLGAGSTVMKPTRMANAIVVYFLRYSVYPNGRKVPVQRAMRRVFVLVKVDGRGWLIDQGGDGWIVRG